MSDVNSSRQSGIRSAGNRLARSLRLFKRVVDLLRYSDQRLSLLVFVLTLAEIALTLGGFFAIKHVVQTVAQSDTLRADAGQEFLIVSAVLALFLSGRICQGLANYFRAAQGYVVTDYVNKAIQERAVAADLSFFDSALYYDNLERARQAGAGRPARVIANVLNVVRGGLMLGGITMVVATIEWMLLPISLCAVLIVLWVQLRFTRERFERHRALVQQERHATYADWLMTSETFAKEIRLWDLGAYLRKLYTDVRLKTRKKYLAIEWRKTMADMSVAVIGTGLFAVAGAFILYRFNSGQATLPDVVMVVLLMLRAETVGRAFVANLSKLYDDQLFLNQLFVFLDLKPDIENRDTARALPPPGEDGIRMENVSFSYPTTETPALEDVSLHLKPGQFTALVGGNGSGKTTLIKLLCRLYDPQTGRITFNGVDVRELDPLAYRRQFSVIFQDFVQFAYSGSDNLRVAELGAQSNAERVKHAAQLTGADAVLQALPKGYDTLLSRMFDDGVELSGGQWQKVALARAIFPQSQFVILDEPTSAIDPNAEAALFEGFRDKLEGRGALVISHRLSTVRMADYTYVLEEGRIVEHGTHDALIKLNGSYAAMFERQGRSYRS